MTKPDPEPTMVDLAELTDRRKQPVSPRERRRAFGILAAILLVIASFVAFAWLLLR